MVYGCRRVVVWILEICGGDGPMEIIQVADGDGALEVGWIRSLCIKLCQIHRFLMNFLSERTKGYVVSVLIGIIDA